MLSDMTLQGIEAVAKVFLAVATVGFLFTFSIKLNYY